MKLNRTLLSIISTAIILLSFFSAYMAIYAVNYIEQKQLIATQLSLLSSAEMAMRITNYQGQKVRFEGKEVEKAKVDSLRLIKEMLIKRHDISLHTWVGQKSATDITKSEQIHYTSLSPQELKLLQQRVGELSNLKLDETAKVFQDYVVFPLNEWGWYGVIVVDLALVKQEIAQQSIRIYLFFLFFVLVVMSILLGIIFYTLANYQKVELGPEQVLYISLVPQSTSGEKKNTSDRQINLM